MESEPSACEPPSNPARQASAPVNESITISRSFTGVPPSTRRLSRESDQPSLFNANGDAAKRPRIGALLPRLLKALDGRGWIAARRLTEELGADDRAIREAASHSAGRV